MTSMGFAKRKPVRTKSAIGNINNNFFIICWLIKLIISERMLGKTSKGILIF